MNRLTIFVILLVSIGTACADAGTALDSNASSNKPASISQVPAPLMAVTDTDAVNKQNEATVVPQERKIIRNGELTLEAAVPEETQRAIGIIVESKGGFVVESQQSTNDLSSSTRDTVTMKVRVPAEKFTETVEEVRKTAARVVVETVKGQDVTEEFVDIEARLKAKKQLEAQMMEIMKRAGSVEDALNVQKELGTVRAEIEQIEGRKRFLENQASLSTINIRIQTPAAITGSSKGFLYRLGEAASTGFNGALTFVLFLVTLLIAILPFLLLIVLPLTLLGKYLLKRQRRAQSIVEIAREEIKTD